MATQDRQHIRSRPVLGVSVCIVKEGRALLTQRARPPFEDRWSLPGGHVEGGERLEAAARREVEEETGLKCKIGELFHWVEIVGEDKHYVIAIFLARWIQGEPRPQDDAKAVRWATAEEAAQLQTTPELDQILVKALRR
jgi:8-oxo-dGTP diphosphatase